MRSGLLIFIYLLCFYSVCFSEAIVKVKDETIRDDSIVFYGERFRKIWTLKNIGEKPWKRGYKFRFKNSEIDNNNSEANKSMATITSFELENEVTKDNECTFSVQMVVPVYSKESVNIKEFWYLYDDQDKQIGEPIYIKIKAVNCPISNYIEYPVGYPIKNVKKQAYAVDWDFVDQHYNYGDSWHHSEDWNGKANRNDLNDPVYAISDGYVVYSEDSAKTGLGKVILIRHVRIINDQHEPFYARYAHLNARNVSVGKLVHRGQIIGKIGMSGTKASHLDFGIIKNNLFTIQSYEEYHNLNNQRIEMKEPVSYSKASRNWLFGRAIKNPDSERVEDSVYGRWIMNNYYNPLNSVVNSTNDQYGHRDKKENQDKYNKGDIFFNPNTIIIDDQDPEFTKTETEAKKFTEYTKPLGHYYCFPKDPKGLSAKWSPNITKDAYYEVIVGFWAAKGEPDQVTYTIKHADGITDKVISQGQPDKGEKEYGWVEVKLGDFRFEKEQDAFVEIKEIFNANVDLLILSEINYQDIIIDNLTQNSFMTTNTDENKFIEITNDYKNYLKFPESSEGLSAEWQPDIPITGFYNVFVGFWVEDNSPDSVNYTIKHADGEDTVTISQKKYKNGDNYKSGIFYQIRLGEKSYKFNSGKNGAVVIENCPYANVDQVYFKPVPPVLDINAHINTTIDYNLSKPEAGNITITGENLGSQEGAIRITAKIDENIVHFNPTIDSWEDNQIIFNIFNSSFDLNKLKDSVEIEITNNSNILINKYNYPFKDINYNQWFSSYTTKLWKQKVIQGKGTTGKFAPADNVLFSEFFKMLVISPKPDDTDIDLPDCTNSDVVIPFEDISLHVDNWYCSYYKDNNIQDLLKKLRRIDGEADRGHETQAITRKEAAFFLASSVYGVVNEVENFADVDKDNPFYSYIQKCKALKIFSGHPDGTFKPENEIIRAEISKVFYQAFFVNRLSR